MKGNPAVPGDPLTSKPAWRVTCKVPHHAGFFFDRGGMDERNYQGQTRGHCIVPNPGLSYIDGRRLGDLAQAETFLQRWRLRTNR